MTIFVNEAATFFIFLRVLIFNVLHISRERLKQFIDQKMEEGNISCSDTSEIVRSMVDYTCLEQWKQSGLSTDDFFLQNAIALTSTKR